MTSPLRQPAGSPGPAASPLGGSLRLVPLEGPLSVPRPRPQAPRAPFLLVVISLVGAGLLGLLGLHTALAEDAFRLYELQRQGRVLADQEQALALSVEAATAPEALATRARALGMVDGGPPAFLRLSDGAVLGQPGPVISPGPLGRGASDAGPTQVSAAPSPVPGR